MRVDPGDAAGPIDEDGASSGQGKSSTEGDHDFSFSFSEVEVPGIGGGGGDGHGIVISDELVPAGSSQDDGVRANVALVCPDLCHKIGVVLTDGVSSVEVHLHDVVGLRPNDEVVYIGEGPAGVVVTPITVIVAYFVLQTARPDDIGRIQRVVKSSCSAVRRADVVGSEPEPISIVDPIIGKDTATSTTAIARHAALTDKGSGIGGLTVHEHIESIVVELVDIVGGQRNMVDPDTDGNGSDGNCGVEHLGDPQSHKTIAA